MLAYFPRHHVFHHAPPSEFLTRATICGGLFFTETGYVRVKPSISIFDDVCCARTKIKDDFSRPKKKALKTQLP